MIALTHMRLPNDIDLVKKVPGIDLSLGGHDHDYDYYVERDQEGNQIGEVVFVQSGSDF